MLLLFLLGAFSSVGHSYCYLIEYGDTYSLKLRRGAESIEFTKKNIFGVTVLWKRNDPQMNEDSRRKLVGYSYVMYNLTQDDSGFYTVRDQNRISLATTTIEVKEKTSSSMFRPGETLKFTFNLDPDSCNIYFLPESGRSETEIVRNGRLQYNLHQFECVGFALLKPCGISNGNLEQPCSGRYEIRDQNGNRAFVMSLEMVEVYNPSPIFTGAAAFSIICGLCLCLKLCCCRKSSSNNKEAETSDAEPAVRYQEYDTEPARIMSEGQHAATDSYYPTQPSTHKTSMLIHNPQSIKMPDNVQGGNIFERCRMEVSAPEKKAGAPTVPVQPDPDLEPRFELKGMTFPSLLSSESSCNDVYTSNKLNFL